MNITPKIIEENFKFKPAKNPKFSAGDIVMVTNSGQIYDSYRSMAYVQGILNDKPGTKEYEQWHVTAKKGIHGEVLSVLRHGYGDANVYAIRPEKGKAFLIKETGIVLKEKGSYIPKELFDI